MTSITGSTAPLHRRFNEQESLRQIRERYEGCKNRIADQVRALQLDPEFAGRCETLYARGYKDWHILSAIVNLMIDRKTREHKIDLRTVEGRNASTKLPETLRGTVYPSSVFSGMEFEQAFRGHALTCLKRYGFESRGVAMDVRAVEKFLRERMKHFDLDIPHAPMFGRPPGDWPKVER